MVTFSKDVDILKYEPNLFGELYPHSQVLAEGTGGSLSGTTFTKTGEDFTSAGVEVGGVVYLQSADGVIDGAFEIVSVDSATQLTVSVVRADSTGSAIAPPAAANITYRISTFKPQAAEAAFQLTEYFGLEPGNPAGDYDSNDILDSDVLKQAAVFAIITTAYMMLASNADNEIFFKKAKHYQKLFTEARQRCRLSIDSDSDGIADVTILGASSKLVRD
ncbi:MAG: hypothetical protein KAJ19_09150 [Gammaproteobacteria bacterium]|nr:hypothetical protein [Gammaproteobacteria bacterium]